MNFNECSSGMKNVFHRGIYKVLCKNSLDEMKKELTFLIEKYSESNHLKVIISDDRDPCFLCVLVVTRTDYDELKKQQGLLIDFDSFPAQLVRLLQQSLCGNMFLLLQQQAGMQIFLEIIEHNEFKRLVHLSLKTGPASDGDIKRNMADNILNLKKKLSEVSSQLLNKENLFQETEQILQAKVKDLNLALSREREERIQNECDQQEVMKREREKLDQERIEWKRCADLYAQTQANSMQEALTRKDKQLEDASVRCRQLQETIKSFESQIMDKNQRILSLEKQLHTVRSDAETWRNQNGALDREYHDKELNLQQTRARLMDTEKTLKDKSDMLREALDSLQSVKREKTLKDKSDMLREALDSLQSVKREKAIFEEKLGECETLASKCKTEARTTGEQLLKANQIIAKQNVDLLEIREKLMCRTAIALEQEKVIDRNSAEIAHIYMKEKNLNEEIGKLKIEIEKLKSEIEVQKHTLSEKEETIKNNHSVIQWLHKKLDTVQSNNDLTTLPSGRMQSLHSSTPFLSSHLSSEKHTSDNNNEMLNAYTAGLDNRPSAPSQFTNPKCNMDLSDDATVQPVLNKYSVDPKYLRPAKASFRSKSQDSSKSGTVKSAGNNKENRTANRPVSRTYQPDKSNFKRRDDRDSSPISAYFPRL